MKNEPDWMREFRLQSLEIFRVQADAQVGWRHRHRFPGHLLLPEADRSSGPDLGRSAAGNQGDVRQAGNSRSGEEIPGRREGPVRKRSRLRLAERRSGGEGRHLHRHRHGRAGASRICCASISERSFRRRQQVRRAQLGRLVGRFVHLRAAGRVDRFPAAGLLPHQRGKHGPVRADADHRRRRSPGALRRRLHGSDVQHRKPALGGGRDHRANAVPAAATRRSRTGPTTSTTW